MGDMTGEADQRNVESLLWLSWRKVGRKFLMDKDHKVNSSSMSQMKYWTADCFGTKRNRTLDCHAFFSRKRTENESLHQFWKVLYGVVPKRDFGNQPKSIIYEIFILNMEQKQVQEKNCIEPKATPKEALQFAFVFEKGLKGPKTIGQTSVASAIKDDPLFAFSSKTKTRKF